MRANTMDTSKKGADEQKGAAEEPEPEPGPPSSPATAAPYDPRVYQPPHPDDRGGHGGGTAPKKGGGAKAKGKDGADGKGKADHDDDDGTHHCGNCDAPDAKSKCKGCGVEYYCNRECQTVRTRVVDAIGGRVRTWVGAAQA